MYLLLIWMWRKLKRSWTALDLIRILRPFRPHRPSPEGHRDLPGVTLPPLPRPQHPSLSPQKSHQDPILRSELGESVRGVRGSPSRRRGSIRQEALTLACRDPSGGSLVWAVPCLSDRRHHAARAAVGLGSARARRSTPKRQHHDGLLGGPASKAASRSESERQGEGTRAGSSEGGGGVS